MQIDNSKEKLNVISLIREGLCSSRQGALYLGMSQRQIQRLLKRVRESNNILTLCSPRPRNCWNKKSEELKDMVLSLKKERTQRANCCIADILKERGHSISPATVRKILIDNNCYSSKEKEKRSFKIFEAKKAGRIVRTLA